MNQTIDYQKILENIYNEVKPLAKEGKQADYIPALAEVNPDRFGICLQLCNGGAFELGDCQERFSIQSISKVFSLAIALNFEGEKLWERMGKEPSGTSFNSLVQLEYEHGIPRNPFINAGALVLTDILLSHLANPEEFFLNFVRALCSEGMTGEAAQLDTAKGNKSFNNGAGYDSIDYNRRIAESEFETCYMNAAIANLLKYHHNLNNRINDVLHLYCTLCALEMNCRELSAAFLNFAHSDRPFSHYGVELTKSQVKRLNAIMQTCGFYDEAGEFSFAVGLPGKSGVGGGIAAIYPSKYSIAVWSPRLNVKGNSIMGMKALELFTTETSESIF